MNFNDFMAETVFVYERSEGLTGSNDHLEVPERGESCLTHANGPPWGHLGASWSGPKNGTFFGPIFGPLLEEFLAPK